jgi:hypothetical protein
MYRASVANNQDPLNQARVTLLIPQVLGDAESAWAVPAAPTNTIPPVGQTVWVQFDGGEIPKPVYSPLGIKDVQDQVDTLPGPDGMPPKQPTALTLTTVQYVTAEGATLARVAASWTPPTENQDGTALTDLGHYVVQASYDGVNWNGGLVTTEDLVVIDGLNTGVTFYVRVQALDAGNNASLWSSASITTASASTPPPVPSAPGVVGVLGGLRVTWDGKDTTGTLMPSIFSHVQVQRDTDPAFSNPVVVGTLPGADFLYDSIQNYANAYSYRLVAYSKVGSASAPSASNSGTAKQAVGTDILDGALTSAKIAVGAIDSTKLAAGAVNAQAVADGAIAAGKLAANAVGTTNIAPGAVTGTQLADATIGTAKIINGAIGNAQIADAAINNAKIANLDAGKITTGSLDANRIAAGSLDAAKITAGTLTATQIQAGSLTGDRLAANTVTANQIAAQTITANQMAAGTITAQSGIISSIDGDKATITNINGSSIKANAIDGKTITGAVVRSVRSDGSVAAVMAPDLGDGLAGFQTTSADGKTYSRMEAGELTFGATGVSQVLPTGITGVATGGTLDIQSGLIRGGSQAHIILASGDSPLAPGDGSPMISMEWDGSGSADMVVDVAGILSPRNMAWGKASITPTLDAQGKPVPTSTTVSGLNIRGNVFYGQCTAQSTAIGTQVLGVGMNVPTRTSVTLWVTRTNTTVTNIQWLAIGDKT